ncbi:MAG: hypothetical protein NW900_02580 [Candidatus Blochmannia sp. A2]|nr:hypothetical protein [Candidatus Blochmannia sp. A2]
MYMYMYVCIYIYICMYMYMYVYMYVCMYGLCSHMLAIIEFWLCLSHIAIKYII